MVKQLDTSRPDILPTLLQSRLIPRVLQILKEVCPTTFIRHTQRYFLQIVQLCAPYTINKRVETMRKYFQLGQSLLRYTVIECSDMQRLQRRELLQQRHKDYPQHFEVVHQFRVRRHAELLRDATHTAAEVRRINIEAEHLDQRGQMRLIAEMDEHAMAMLGRAASHVVEEDRREASVERAIDETEREELCEHVRGMLLL